MKKIAIMVVMVVAFASLSFAGVAKASYRYAMKPAAKASFAVAKPVVKVASFPGRHPKKFAHGVKKAID